MTRSDLITFVPWITFGVILGIIAARLLRRRGSGPR